MKVLVQEDSGLHPIANGNTLRIVLDKCAEAKVFEKRKKHFGSTQEAENAAHFFRNQRGQPNSGTKVLQTKC